MKQFTNIFHNLRAQLYSVLQGSGQIVHNFQLLLNNLAVAPAAAVEIRPVLVSHLAARLPSSVLPTFNEPRIEVCPDDPVIQPGAVDKSHGILSVLPEVIFYETEPTGGPLELVQTHHDPLDLPAHPEQFVDLLLGSVETHVAHIESGGLT